MENTSFLDYELHPVAEVDLDDLKQDVITHISKFVENYIWHKEPFRLRVQNNKCLKGRLNFGDNVEDEWFAIGLLRELTSTFDLVARVTDEDGEILLIEAADHLPKWAQEPDLAEARVYLYKGQVHLIPVADRPSQLTPIPTGVPKVAEAVRTVANFAEVTLASEAVQRAVSERIGAYPQDWSTQRHLSHCFVPVKVALILETAPQLVSEAIRKMQDSDPIDLKACQTMKHFPEEDLVKVDLVTSKLLFAMLEGQKIWPYKKSGWALPAKSDPTFAERHRGFKVTCGFEIMAKYLGKDVEKSGEDSEAYKKYLAKLESSGYFQGLLPGSKGHSDLLQKARIHFHTTSANLQSEEASSIFGAQIKESFNVLKASDFKKELHRFKSKELSEADDASWLEMSHEEFDAMLARQFALNNDIEKEKVPDILKTFLSASSDMKGVEETDETEEQEEGREEFEPISFQADGFEAAFAKILAQAKKGGMNRMETVESHQS